MAEPAVGGDLVLSARPATPEAFAPFGRLLYGGDRARIGAKGRVLVALDTREAGPRRVAHLQAYPEAVRLVFSLSETPLVLLVGAPGDRPAGPPEAFRVPGGVGVLLHAGVWHAGPIPLSDTTLLEMLEIRGQADRLDRRSVAEVLGVEGVRFLLPDEPGGSGPGIDLDDEGVVVLAPEVRGRLTVALLALDGLSGGESPESLGDETDRVASAARTAWGDGLSPAREIASRLDAVRQVFAAIGIDPKRSPPPVEGLLRRAVEGRALPRAGALADAVALASLETLTDAAAHDLSRIAGPIALRLGAAGESYPVTGKGRVAVAGRLVLADREGAFASPGAEAGRARVGAATRRALVVLHLPPGAAGEAGRLLDRFSERVRAYCGGEEVGRRVVS